MRTSDTTQRDTSSQKMQATISVDTKINKEPTNLWQWLAIGEAVIIVLLLFSVFLRKRQEYSSKHQALIDEAKAGEVDFKDVLSSAFHAEALYKKLIRVCHPDRFPKDIEPHKYEWGMDITARLGKAQHSFRQLRELQQEIEDKLKITIK